MGCNCGDNEYNITVDNNGNCEPTTPIYNITLANVGVNGYSPIVRFINETVESFNIAVDNITGTETSPAVPKLSYVADQINNINTTIAGLNSTYLTRDGSNAASSVTFNNIQLSYVGATRQTIRATNSQELLVAGQGLYLQGHASQAQSYPNAISIAPQGTSISIGNANRHSVVVDNDGAFYDGNEIATLSDMPTVGNGTIAIMMNGAIKGSFKVNQSNNTVLDLGSTSNYTAGNGINITNNIISVDETDLSFLKNDGSNADSNIEINGTSLGTNYISKSGISSGGLSLFQTDNQINAGLAVGSNGANLIVDGFIVASSHNGNISIYANGINRNILIDSSSNGKTYYHGSTANDEIATKGNLPTNFIGCDSITGGTSGLVPAPSAGDEDKFLKADGTWDTVGGGSSYTAGTGIDITNDTISVDSSVVLTSGNQTISDTKTFQYINLTNSLTIPINSVNRTVLLADTGTLYVGTKFAELQLSGSGNRPKFNGTQYLALYSDIPTVPTNISAFTNDSGYITGINSSDVTTALGYTPYNSTNPDGYITSSALAPYALSASLATVATTGAYSDLIGTPTIPTVNDPTITFTQGGVTKGTITLNQSGDATIALDAGSIPSVIDGGNA